MANIGNIPIPTPTLGSPFPITPDYPHSIRQDYSIATHTFGSSNRKISQRYLLGTGSRLFTITRQHISTADRNSLRDHWETNKGPTHQFLYAFPDTDQAATTNVLVRYESEPLVWDVRSPKTFGTTVQLREVIESGPSLSITSTVTRYPSGGLPTALLSQAQLLIPLVKITVREVGYPVIYLSDRLITVGGQLYQPRLTDWDGISQTLGSGSDDAGFSFGNADLVFTLLANDVDLVRASLEFSLLHLSAFDGSGTNTKIDLWKGEINSWEDQEDSTDFRVRASNILYELTLPWPPRLVERGCWKPFNDGVACPYATQGTLDTANYPSASGSSCDKGFFTPNGCAAHTMHRYHGGIQAEPQGVLIKNNGTGTWGFGRELVNSTSLINDSAYGQPIPTVYTDSAMPVAALVVSGRDESDFYEALGVVSEGPVTFATPSGLDLHTLDGQPHHGHPGAFGLRTIPGSDPAGATDFFSLDQSGNQVGSNPQLIYSGSSTYRNVFAAGTSALVIRRTDEKGIQLTRPTDHQMTAIVSQGKQGWVWTAPSTRSLATLTNPVWIAINAFLRALGLENASAAVAETYFDVGAAIASAAICDTTVSKIAGLSGTETQFKFRGTVRDRKYLGDWLTDILDNCLAYMVNTFGKLKIGMRVNSSVVEAFTVANTLIDSLRLYPISPSFNHIVVEFDDELFNYQRNTIHVEAADHKALTGKTLTKTKSLIGTSGASQAGRIASVLLKEELGGATLAEWRKARTIRFKTTILALNVEPGMVCSMTHERMPDGAGEFRVYSWQLNKDFSIDVEGRTTTDAIYDLAQGPKPADVLPSAIPIEQVQYPRRPGWMAGANRGSASDPIQGFQEFSIVAGESYETNADGSVQALINVSGLSPRNRFLSVPATIIRTITPSTSSGTIPAGNWWVSVAPYKNATAGKQFGPPSNLLATNLSAAGKITIGGIDWPEPPSGSWDGYTYMLGDSEQSLCQNDIASAPPSSIEITFDRRFSQALQPNIAKVRAKVKLCPWPGIVRGAVSSVTSTTIVVGSFAGGGDAFSGRRLSIISDDSDGTPGVWNFTCSAYDEPTGTFTVTPDPTVAGVGAGDMLVVLTSPSSITSTGYSDTAYNFSVDELIGYSARILYGTGRGQARTIVSNTATGVVVEPAWTTNPDSTSVIVIEEAGWGYSADSARIENLSGLSIQIGVPVDNLPNAVVLVAGFGVDTFDNESPESATPMRILFLKGEPFQVEVSSGAYSATVNDRTILVDSTTDQDITLAPVASTKGNRIVVKRIAGSGTVTLLGDIDGGASFTLDDSVILESDGVEYRSLVSGAGGGGGGGTDYHTVTLTANATVSKAVGTAGVILTLRIKQDATGGWVATLDTGDFSEQPVFETAANAVNICQWVSDGTKWQRTSEVWVS